MNPLAKRWAILAEVAWNWRFEYTNHSVDKMRHRRCLATTRDLLRIAFCVCFDSKKKMSVELWGRTSAKAVFPPFYSRAVPFLCEAPVEFNRGFGDNRKKSIVKKTSSPKICNIRTLSRRRYHTYLDRERSLSLSFDRRSVGERDLQTGLSSRNRSNE